MEPTFLTSQQVEQIHASMIELYGGRPGLRDRNILESAVNMPRQGVGGKYLHNTIEEMAAAYAFHLAQGQPFVDGNKRVGLASASTFLLINGFEFAEPFPSKIMNDVAEHLLTKENLAREISKLIVRSALNLTDS